MKKILILLCLCISVICIPSALADTVVYQDLIDEITNERAESIYDIELNAPFEKNKSGIREEVDVETGNVSVKYDFFSFPAHGGQSFDFGAVYNVNLAKELDESINEAGDANEAVEKTGYESSLYSLGIGWRVDLPGIETQSTRNKTRIYVHLPGGAVYIADSSEECGLDDYELDNLKFSTANTTLAGVTYYYTLTYKDGTCYYFGSDGLCKAKSDRFMNIVTYSWDAYDGEKQRLIAVKDNCGRTVLIEYGDKTVTISCGERRYILNRSASGNGGYIVNSITDPEGRKTEFKYYEEEVTYNFFPDDLDDDTNVITALSRIIYPTGLSTCYEYETSTKWLYEKEDGTIEYLKLKKRYDIEDSKHTNLLEYSYNKEPGGYPTYKSDDIPDAYEYHITETDSFGSRTTYTYNGKHNPIRTVKTSEGYKSEESSVVSDTQYNLPKTMVNKLYTKDGAYRQITTERSYDSRGNLLSADTYEVEKGKYRVDFEYSGKYDICTYESYMQNDDVKVETVRTLSEGSKNIASESMLQNGMVVKHDEYEYNYFGDVTLSKMQTDTNTYLTTEYVYSGYMPYPSEIIQKDIANADGICEDIITKYTYDVYGNPTAVTLPNGAQKYYEYDKLGRVIRETLEDGNSRSNAYNDRENVLTTTDARGTSLIYDYDSTGALICVTDPVTGTLLTQREYDAKKRLVKEKDAKGAIAISEYDSKDRLTQYSVKDAEGKLYSHIGLTYDDALNTVTTVKSDGVKTITNVYTYDMFNQLTEQTLITSDSQYTVEYEYDRVGNNIIYTDESGNITKSEYDIFGNPIKLISPMGNTEEYTYDLLGNVTRYVNGEGDVQEYVYDALGRQIISKKYFEGMCSEYKTYYDVMGNAIKTVDENGNETTYEYNERNLLTSSKAYAETGNGIKTEYAYDAEGSITLTAYGSISDPLKRNTTKNYYDHLGNLTKRVDNSGKISYYEYDGAGQLIKSTDPKSTETVYEYDVLGRQTRISNDINPDTIYSYNLFGELESITEGDKYIAYTYDERGYLTKSSTGITEDTYIYDERGNVLEHVTTDKTAGEIRNTYTYDADNRTTSVITPLGIQALSYDKANRLIKSENSRTGSVRQIVYDQRGLPVSAITRLGDTTLSTENNVYDFMGNKVRSEENGYVREYKYDGLNRLTSVSEDNKETLYEFDAYGNIAKEHEIVGLKLNTKLYYYDKDNRLILTEKDSNVTSYEYDANGNLTRELSKYSDIHYEYDGYNRLTNVIKPNEIISYEYNAEGFRDRKYTKDGMTRFIYDSGSVSAEILPDGNVYKYYRADGIVGSIDSTGNKLYYSQNTHGDVTTIYDVTGIVLKDYRYSAYGKPQTIKYNGINQPYLIQWYAETNSVHNPFGYCGEYTDSETGFVYLRNRYYDPSTGRFVQEDPVRDGLNLYIYAKNNPIKYVDPNGTVAIQLGAGFTNMLIDTSYLAFTDAIEGEYGSLGKYAGTAIGSFVEGVVAATPGLTGVAPLAGGIVNAVVKNAIDGTFDAEDVFIDTVVNVLGGTFADKVNDYVGCNDASRQVIRNALRKAGVNYTGDNWKNIFKNLKSLSATLEKMITLLTQSIVDELDIKKAEVKAEKVAKELEKAYLPPEDINKSNYIGQLGFRGIVYTASYIVDGKEIIHYDPLGIPDEWLIGAVWWEVGK